MATRTLSGTYTGPLNGVDYSIYNGTTDALVSDWATLDAAPSGGLFSGSVTMPARGGPYYLKLRASNDHSVVTSLSSSKFYYGYRGLFIGQSNMVGSWSRVQGTPGDADSLTRRYSGGAAWYLPSLTRQSSEPSTNQGAAGFGGNGDIGYTLAARPLFNAPLGLIEAAVSSTTIEQWLTVPNGGTADMWNNMLTVINNSACGAQVDYVQWYQGEGNASIGTVLGVPLDATGTQYYNALTLLAAQIRTLFGATIPIMYTPIAIDASATDANCDAVRQGTYRFVDDNTSGHEFFAHGVVDLTMNADGVTHLSGGQQGGTVRRRAAYAAAKIFGFDANGAIGPKFNGTLTATASNQRITLPVTLNGGSALVDSTGNTAGAGLTGFLAFVNGVAKTISTTAFSTTNILLTLAGGSFVNGDTIAVSYHYGKPNVTNPVYDNNAIPVDTKPGRPLQPTRGQISGTASA